MATETSPPTPRSRVVAAFVITALLTSFVAATYGFGFYLFAQIVTDMRKDLGFGYTVVGTVTASGQLGFLLFALLGTWLSTRVGGGQVTIGSAALCGLCLVLIPLTDSIVVIGVLLTIMGGTAASVYVPLVEIVGRTIDYEHRGKVLGLISSGTSYGVFVNSLLVPSFVGAGNWRGLWYCVGLGTLTSTAIAAFAFHGLGLFRSERASDPAGDALGPRTPGTTVRDDSARAGWRMVLVPRARHRRRRGGVRGPRSARPASAVPRGRASWVGKKASPLGRWSRDHPAGKSFERVHVTAPCPPTGLAPPGPTRCHVTAPAAAPVLRSGPHRSIADRRSSGSGFWFSSEIGQSARGVRHSTSNSLPSGSTPCRDLAVRKSVLPVRAWRALSSSAVSASSPIASDGISHAGSSGR
ncbi:MFS transporter [Streptomyces sp. MNU76]|uniref:MFS transporter n=1 Tax=Streptomyces sp. MNU76 TaxID=2560026 RepID=UPI0027DF7966|nr:MFS transporter [Streptomyces sp. MNU76]